MGKPRKTNEQFVRELHNIKPSILPLESYPANNHTKISVKCKECGYEWKTTPQSLLLKTNGNGCPECRRLSNTEKQRKTHEQFVQELSVVNKTVIPLEKYTRSNKKILCQCTICGNEWKVAPDKLLMGRNCPMCHWNRMRVDRAYSREEFINKLSQINSDIILLGDYINGRTKTTFQCKQCGYIWDTTPFPLLKGVGCPHCHQSKGEERINEYLTNNQIKAKEQKVFDECKYKKLLRFDFYLPDYNLCIEYDGRQHFEPIEYFGGVDAFIKTKKRDAIKNQYCKENNINLLRIPYTEYENIEQIIEKQLYVCDMAKV